MLYHCKECKSERSSDEFRLDEESDTGRASICIQCEEAEEERERLYRRRVRQLNTKLSEEERLFSQEVQTRERERLYPMGQVIYALVDPFCGDVRYVGHTARPNVRLRDHVAYRDGTRAKLAWIDSLKARGSQPQMRVLERVSDGEFVLEREFRWMAKFVREDVDLTNAEVSRFSTDGPNSFVIGVRGSRISNFLSEPRDSKLLNRIVGWNRLKALGDRWYTPAFPLTEAILICLRRRPDDLPERLMPKAKRLLALMEERQVELRRRQSLIFS